MSIRKSGAYLQTVWGHSPTAHEPLLSASASAVIVEAMIVGRESGEIRSGSRDCGIRRSAFE